MSEVREDEGCSVYKSMVFTDVRVIQKASLHDSDDFHVSRQNFESNQITLRHSIAERRATILNIVRLIFEPQASLRQSRASTSLIQVSANHVLP